MVKNLVLRFSPYFKYKIVGSSMSPAIGNGQIIFVNRLAYLFYNPHKSDIIALHDPRDGKILIKRITKINKKKYFVTGDNKIVSTDSRVFGWIEKRDIIGRVKIDTLQNLITKS